ncbi:serine hydrolase domain-containing protein [Agromyces humatus]|uniref:Serine hydrolase n=1 Tax=Agromyces humatus TaxID=279573 RepID=A0ABP4X5M3_9MICO|nr:serine hydrolase domain-containing protein [Agromyces humatus]
MALARLAPLVVISAFAALLVGCTSAPPYSPRVESAPAPPADAVELPEGSVEAALEALPDTVARILDESGVPGAAVAVVSDEELLFAQGFGVRRVGDDAAVDDDTVFQVASMSKPIGATVVATQVSDGVVGWDSPVAPLLPGVVLADAWVTERLTVGDLYAHRSGLPMAAGDDLEDIGYGRDYILEHLRLEPLSPFRSTYHYANFGMTMGAQAVANAAGAEWEDLSDQALYEPLGMDSTSSRYDDFVAHDNRAALHAKIDGAFEPRYERVPDAQSPAGGVSSNVVDLARWMSLVIGEGTFAGDELIAPADLLAATSPHIVAAPPGAPTMRAGSYGFGFNVGSQPSGRTTLGHSGAFTLGAGTNFTIVPALGLGVVALTNGGPVGAAEAIVTEFLDRVQFGEPTRDWLEAYGGALAHYYAPAGDLADAGAPASPAPSPALENLAGTWSNDYFGPAEVEVAGGVATVRLGPDGGYSFELEPWDGDVFAFVPTGENAPDGSLSSATFTFGDGAAGGDRMTLQFFDANRLGTWTRG